MTPFEIFLIIAGIIFVIGFWIFKELEHRQFIKFMKPRFEEDAKETCKKLKELIEGIE